jgi:hypothetical protein
MQFTAGQKTAADHNARFDGDVRDCTSPDEDMDYNFEQPDEIGQRFSLRATVDSEGERCVEESILFTCNQFLELFKIADPVLNTRIPRRPSALMPDPSIFGAVDA